MLWQHKQTTHRQTNRNKDKVQKWKTDRSRTTGRSKTHCTFLFVCLQLFARATEAETLWSRSTNFSCKFCLQIIDYWNYWHQSNIVTFLISSFLLEHYVPILERKIDAAASRTLLVCELTGMQREPFIFQCIGWAWFSHQLPKLLQLASLDG